jgi:[acyl-carrier-protein] S-malonyltransferase
VTSVDGAPTRGVALLFPGQGQQHPGMGRASYERSAEARAYFAAASELLGLDLAQVCHSGPEHKLDDTTIAQVAIYTCNACAMSMAFDSGIDVTAAAGHSVGEMNAMVAAGMLDFWAGLSAVNVRAQLIRHHTVPGRMAAVVGPTSGELQDHIDATSTQPVWIAARDAPNVTMISGTESAVAAIEQELERRMVAKVIPVGARNPFHSPLLEPILEDWARYMTRVVLKPPSMPIALNISGRLACDVEEIRASAILQLTHTVEWVSCITALAAHGVSVHVDTSEDGSLAAFNRRIDRRVSTLAVPDDAGTDRRHRRLEATGSP